MNIEMEGHWPGAFQIHRPNLFPNVHIPECGDQQQDVTIRTEVETILCCSIIVIYISLFSLTQCGAKHTLIEGEEKEIKCEESEVSAQEEDWFYNNWREDDEANSEFDERKDQPEERWPEITNQYELDEEHQQEEEDEQSLNDWMYMNNDNDRDWSSDKENIGE